MARRPEGTVFKKVNKTTGAVTYVASLEIGRTSTGNRIRPTKSAKTYNEAQKLLRDMIAKHESGLLAVKKNDTCRVLASTGQERSKFAKLDSQLQLTTRLALDATSFLIWARNESRI